MNKFVFGMIAFSLAAILFVGLASALGFGFGFGKANFNLTDSERTALQEKRNATLAAIESEDYSAWRALMESDITREKFDNLVQQHKEMAKVHELREQLREAIESKDENKVSELKEQLSDLGFEKGFQRGRGMGRGMMGEGRDSRDPNSCPFA